MKPTRIPLTKEWGIRLALGTAVISGFAVWLNGYGVRSVGDPAVYTTLKNLVAAMILVSLAVALGGGSEARTLRRSQWARLVFIGLIGGSLPFLLFFTGLSIASAPSAAFIHKTLFVWVALMAVPLLGERLGWAQLVALGILFVSQVLIVAPTTEGGLGLGELMILGATLLWSVEVIVAKRLLSDISPSLVGASRLGFGVVMLIGYVVVTGKASMVATLGAESLGWVLITGVVLAGYVGTWYAALRRASATLATSVLVVGAVITTMLAAASTGSSLDARVIVGICGIVLAAAVLVFARHLPGQARVAASPRPTERARS
jgi:drug/metabolite transporter (DMT)-like permease